MATYVNFKGLATLQAIRGLANRRERMSVFGSKNSHAGQTKRPSFTTYTLRAFRDATNEAVGMLSGVLAAHK